MAGWGRFEEAEARNQELETGREKERRGGGVAAFPHSWAKPQGNAQRAGEGLGYVAGPKIGRNPNLCIRFLEE